MNQKSILDSESLAAATISLSIIPSPSWAPTEGPCPVAETQEQKFPLCL